MAMKQDASTGEMVETADDTEVAKNAADSKHPTMKVKVYAPFQVYFEGEAFSLTAVNETGPFDILPHHRNFLCMLLPCDLTIKTPFDEKPKIIKISRALLHVRSERVTVFVDV
jgi:F0F1-type ATP synthase epsilon subunit